MTGTWLKGLRHGICKSLRLYIILNIYTAGISNVLRGTNFPEKFDEKNGPRTITIQEYKNGKKHGQGTVIKHHSYFPNYTEMYENDELLFTEIYQFKKQRF